MRCNDCLQAAGASDGLQQECFAAGDEKQRLAIIR